MSGMTKNQSVHQSFCTFSAADVTCGIPVEDVQEIVSHLTVTPVPRSNHMIAGLINLRGQIVTVVNITHWLHRDDFTTKANSDFHLITKVAGETVSLQVDEMGPVISSDIYQLEPVPKHLDQTVADRLQAVARLADRLVLILKTERIKEIRSLHSAAWSSLEQGLKASVVE